MAASAAFLPSPSLDGYCHAHAAQIKRSKVPSEEPLIGLLPQSEEPPTEDDIHRALARVFTALATNQITTRRAATFGYLAQLLLTTKSTAKEVPTDAEVFRRFQAAAKKSISGYAAAAQRRANIGPGKPLNR